MGKPSVSGRKRGNKIKEDESLGQVEAKVKKGRDMRPWEC